MIQLFKKIIQIIGIPPLLAIALFGPQTVFASGVGGDDTLSGRIDLLIIQVSLITIAAWAGGAVFKRWKLPPVLGEMLAGFVIGPFALGGIPFWGFSNGLFPINGEFPVSIELYSLATIASILLLFFVGLETDIETFIQFAFAGSIIGIFGAIASFVLGDLVGMFYMNHVTGVQTSFFHPVCLFFGVISMATSVGITARILSEKKRTNSADGVTILSAAVIDDILGIVILATVLGIAQKGQAGWKGISIIAGQTLGIWLFFTITGLAFSHRLSALLKKSKDKTAITLISFAIALLLAGIFERTGLAMIIGAYTIGLVFSKTDLAFLIQEKLSVLQRFFVPIFFCVMGMFIDPRVFISSKILMFGGIYIVVAVIGKFLGCFLPAMCCNFNWRGAARIGMGMIPRGEVALIVAGVGISRGSIDHEVFSIAVVMTFVTTLLTPPILNRMLSGQAPVLRKNPPPNKSLINIHFDMPNPETAEFLHRKILDAFRNEGFHAHRQYHGLYFIRKDTMFITMRYSRHFFDFECPKRNEILVNVLFYEVIAELERFMQHLQSFSGRYYVGKKIIRNQVDQRGIIPAAFTQLSPLAVDINLRGDTKEEIFKNLMNLVMRSGQSQQNLFDGLLAELKKREESMSTGMQDGIALPHTKTELIDQMIYAIGVRKDGVDFESLDGKKTQIFVLILVPKTHPEKYLQSVSEISNFLSDQQNREKILSARDDQELLMVLKGLM